VTAGDGETEKLGALAGVTATAGTGMTDLEHGELVSNCRTLKGRTHTTTTTPYCHHEAKVSGATGVPRTFRQLCMSHGPHIKAPFLRVACH